MTLRNLLRTTRRRLGLSPMRRLLRELRRRGVDPGSMHALELFGGNGSFHTQDYAREVASLEVWEVDERYLDALRRNLPGADIRIVDSFKEVTRRGERYDLVVVDNPMSTYNGHCEHFGLFPDIFRLANDRAVVVVNVIPYLTDAATKRYPYLFNREQLVARAAFYRTTHPQEVSLETMLDTYRRHAAKEGFEIEWHCMVRRHFVYYLALMVVHRKG